MENGKKVKVLIVGAAFAGDLHMTGYDRCKDIAKVVAICDKDESKVRALAREYGLEEYEVYTDYSEAIENVSCDVVDICLPNFLHHEVAIEALQRGRHVIVEKPLATKLEYGKKILKEAEKAGKRVYYAEDWIFAPALIRAKEIIDEGAIGDLLYIRARECHSGSHSPFAQTIEYCGGGSLIHLGTHPLAYVLSLKENRWTELSAVTSGGEDANMLHKGLEGEDWAMCTLKFEDGTRAMVEAHYITFGGMEDIIDFYGTKGRIQIDLTMSSPVKCFSIPGVEYSVEKAEITTGWSRPAVDEKYNLGYVDEIRHFMECIIEDKEAMVGLRGIDGLETLRVINLAYESAREGKRIVNDRL
ncbi:MAG: Gfo/Idh/MocA family oxidoreductase [Clostridiales bacterium]|nr:Gfo/Idh/MocA family oxidoreductase [Clostridiales bacterium]